jgi:hypothetical protein
MAEGDLSGTQRMLQRRTSPELFAAMERESRLWKAECPHCRTDTPFWELGGVRYKAAGEPKKRMRCPGCGQTGWLRVHWTGGDPTALGPRPSVTPLVLKLVLVTVLIPLLLIGAIAGILIAVL